MEFLSYVRSLFLLSLPLIGGHIAQILIGVGDTLIVGRYSTEALAALVLGTTIFFIIFIFGAGFSFAAMALVSTANTEGDTTKIRRITRMALWLSLAFGLLVSPIFIFSYMEYLRGMYVSLKTIFTACRRHRCLGTAHCHLLFLLLLLFLLGPALHVPAAVGAAAAAIAAAVVVSPH